MSLVVLDGARALVLDPDQTAADRELRRQTVALRRELRLRGLDTIGVHGPAIRRLGLPMEEHPTVLLEEEHPRPVMQRWVSAEATHFLGMLQGVSHDQRCWAWCAYKQLSAEQQAAVRALFHLHVDEWHPRTVATSPLKDAAAAVMAMLLRLERELQLKVLVPPRPDEAPEDAPQAQGAPRAGR